MKYDVLCISHVKDADGICSATIVRMAKGGKTLLADYSDIIKTLASVKEVNNLYICDLGLNAKNANDFIKHTSRLAKKGKVEYIDHHPINEDIKNKLEKEGILVTHSIEESCAMLVYERFKEEIPKRASMIAAFGAIGDFMDSKYLASKIIENSDRVFLLYEASMLSQSIAIKQSNEKFLLKLIKDMTNGKMPHTIEGVVESSIEQAAKINEIIKQIESEGKVMKNLAWVINDKGSSGSVASILLGVFNVPVGIALKNEEKGKIEMSIRASSKCKSHLGELIGQITTEIGGFGGGHPRASGAQIPSNKIKYFLETLDQELKISNE